jgi:hypothetical protein
MQATAAHDRVAINDVTVVHERLPSCRRLYAVRHPSFTPSRRSNHAARLPHAAPVSECSISTQRRFADPGDGCNRCERSHRASRDGHSLKFDCRNSSRGGVTHMMRLLLCIGDQPATGGAIESSGGTNFSIMGHKVALIGALVHCNACKSSGPIAKAGGPGALGIAASK